MIFRIAEMRIVVTVALLALATGCGVSPEATVEKFFMAVGRGDVTEAKTYLSAQFVGVIGEAKLTAGLAAQADEVRNCGGIQKVVVALSGDGDVRTGKSTVTFAGDCPTDSTDVRLIKEDGKWKLAPSK